MITMQTLIVFVSAVGLALLTAIGESNAKVVQWELENVKFDDGEPITGSFRFDADANPDKRLVSADIAITSDGQLPAYHFYFTSPDAGPRWFPEADIDCGNPAGCLRFYSGPFLDIDPMGRVSLVMDLMPTESLLDAGGKIEVRGNQNDTYFGPSRSIVSGQLVAVPEPSKAVLIALLLAALATRLTTQKTRTSFPSLSQSSV